MSTVPAIIQIVQSQGSTNLPTEDALKQFDPSQHQVFDKSKRKQRKRTIPTGEFKKDPADPTGKALLRVNGELVPETRTVTEDVNRIAIPLQKLIVIRRAAFMNTGRMNIIAKPEGNDEERLLEMVKKCRADNKMEFKSTEIAERQMSELQVAELWYSEPVAKGYWGELAPNGIARMRMKIISPALGDKLFPVFNGAGELVYFGRGYQTKQDLTDQINWNDPMAVAATDVNAKEVNHLDIYSKDGVLKFEQQNGVWVLQEAIKYTYGKLPIIYYSQAVPEWNDVQPIIERLETLVSNFADVVDANASPVLFAKGVIRSMPARGETAKVINVVPQINSKGEEVGGSDLKYITWDAAPEAVRLEIDNLVNFIYTGTQTPDISTKGMADLGVKSGTGFDRVFIDAHLAAMRHTNGTYGECTQRSINFLKSACISIDKSLANAEKLEMSPDFPLFRINDERETIEMLTLATGSQPILSQKTAVGMSGLVQDAEKEFEQIQAEQDTLGREISAEPKGKKEVIDEE
ncbi:MAG TPA: phage portal protein [Sphingobacteriaceae bacterium]